MATSAVASSLIAEAESLRDDARPWRIWEPLGRGTAAHLLVVADCLVLLGYLAVGRPIWRALLLTWTLTLLGFSAEKLYQPRLHLSLLDDLPAVLRRLAFAGGLVGSGLALLSTPAHVQKYLTIVGVGAVVHVVLRGCVLTAVRWARRTGRSTHRTLVLGGGELSRKLVEVLDAHPSYGLRVLGYLDDGPWRAPGQGNWVHIGGLANLSAVAQAFDVQVLLVGFPEGSDEGLVSTLREVDFADRPVLLVPRLFEIGHWRAATDHIGAFPVVRMRLASLRGPSWVVKRLFDVLLACVALLLLSPVLALVAMAVRLEGGPGVIFRQERIGRDGRPFELLKFRSLRPATSTEAAVTWNVAQDPRMGRVGRFLRRTSIDELPQLVNILRGDMTFVGPRPERPFFVEQFSSDFPHYADRHRVTVGLTGLAQVSGLRGDTSIDDRARFDNYYIEHWSLWLDIKVVLRTLGQVFGAKGA